MFATFEFQRAEKDENGKEVYLWYQEKTKSWHLTLGSSFKARTNQSLIYIKSQGKQEL